MSTSAPRLSRQSGIYNLHQELEEVEKDPVQFVDVCGISKARFEEVAEVIERDDDDESVFVPLPDGGRLAKVIKDDALLSIGSQLKQVESDCQKSIAKKSKLWADKEGSQLKALIRSAGKHISVLKSKIKASSNGQVINSLEDELMALQASMDENKKALYFPNSQFTLGSNGLFIGLDDIWIENLQGSFSLSLQPGQMVSKITFSLYENSSRGQTSDQGLEVKLRLDGLKLKSDKSILNLSLNSVQLEMGIKVRIEIHYNIAKREYTSHTFGIEILHFKGSFGLSRSIVSGVLAMTIPIIRYKILKSLPFELGQIIADLPQEVNIEGNFDLSEKIPLDDLQHAMFKSEKICQLIGFSPMQMVMFVGLQKSMERKNVMKSIIELVMYRRKFEKESEWEVMKIFWDQACLVYYSRILNDDVDGGASSVSGGKSILTDYEGITGNNDVLSFEKLLLGIEEVTNHSMEFHFSLSKLQLQVYYNSIFVNIYSFFDRWRESLMSRQKSDSLEYKRDEYVVSQIQSQFETIKNILQIVKNNVSTLQIPIQVSLHGGSDGSLTAVLDNVQALGSLALYMALPQDCDIGYDFVIPLMTNVRAKQDGVVGFRIFHLGCNEMLEKVNFSRFKEEYDKDPNFSGLGSLRDFHRISTSRNSERFDRQSVQRETYSYHDRSSVFRSSRITSIQEPMKKHSSSGVSHRQSMAQIVRAQEETALKSKASKVKCGWLTKEGHLFKTWCQRWFVLNKGMLKYYVNSLDKFPYGQGLKGEISLQGYHVGKLSETLFELRATYDGGKDFFIEAKDNADCESWIEAIKLHMDYWHSEELDHNHDGMTDLPKQSFSHPNTPQASDEKLRLFQKRMVSMHKRQSETDFDEVECIMRNITSHDMLTAYELLQINLCRPQVEFIIDKPITLEPGAVLFTAGAGSVSSDWQPYGSRSTVSTMSGRPSYLANTAARIEGCPLLLQTSQNIKIKIQVSKVQVEIQLPKLIRYISLHLEDQQLFLHSMAMYSATHSKPTALLINKLAKAFLTFISTYLLLPNLSLFVNISYTVTCIEDTETEKPSEISSDGQNGSLKSETDGGSASQSAEADTGPGDICLTLTTPSSSAKDCIKLFLKINRKDVINDVAHLRDLMLQYLGGITTTASTEAASSSKRSSSRS